MVDISSPCPASFCSKVPCVAICWSKNRYFTAECQKHKQTAFLEHIFLYLLWCDAQRAEAAGTCPDKQLQPNNFFLWRNILRKQFMAKSRYFYKNLSCKCLAESKIRHRMSTLLQVFYMSLYSVLKVINLDGWFLK